jgi:hypothetical protein
MIGSNEYLAPATTSFPKNGSLDSLKLLASLRQVSADKKFQARLLCLRSANAKVRS